MRGYRFYGLGYEAKVMLTISSLAVFDLNLATASSFNMVALSGRVRLQIRSIAYFGPILFSNKSNGMDAASAG